jgi:hypothetical protein
VKSVDDRFFAFRCGRCVRSVLRSSRSLNRERRRMARYKDSSFLQFLRTHFLRTQTCFPSGLTSSGLKPAFPQDSGLRTALLVASALCRSWCLRVLVVGKLSRTPQLSVIFRIFRLTSSNAATIIYTVLVLNLRKAVSSPAEQLVLSLAMRSYRSRGSSKSASSVLLCVICGEKCLRKDVHEAHLTEA